MELTQEKLAHIRGLYDRIDTLEQDASDVLKAAKQNQGNQIVIARQGKPVELQEKNLWDEVFALGAKSEAGKILADKYPDAFKKSAEHQEAIDELTVYCQAELGINPLAMRMRDVFAIAEAVVEYKLQQYGGHADS